MDGPAFTGSALLEGSPRKLASALGVQLKPHAQDALLFKGSRGMRMERALALFLGEEVE